MRTTIEKQPKQKQKLTEAFALWRNKAQSGEYYLSGYANGNKEFKLLGYFNPNKNNPKEPDVRVYSLDSNGKRDKEVASLWENLDRNEERYLTGTTDEKEKIVAWYGKENEEKRPYIRAYYKQD